MVAVPFIKTMVAVPFISFIFYLLYPLSQGALSDTARPTGFEPATSPVTGECSNQLSYDRNFLFYKEGVSAGGIEPPTLGL